MIEFFVPGIPAPGGSKKGFPYHGKDGRTHAAVVDAGGQRVKDWRASVGLAAGQYFMMGPVAWPIAFAFRFYFPRPLSHYGTGKRAMVLKPSAPMYHTSPPDATKLVRSTEDALKGIAWLDDAQVIEQHASKRYVDRYGGRPGCQVAIWQPLLERAPEWLLRELAEGELAGPLFTQESLPEVPRG